jgi:hypothetical protein
MSKNQYAIIDDFIYQSFIKKYTEEIKIFYEKI